MTSTTYFSTSLNVQIIENYGQVKVLDSSEKPIPKVYVKCFAKTRNGVVNFYKDGYTDLRGRFDYATLNTTDVSSIEKYSLFIMQDELGSLIREATAPNTVGKIEGAIELKSKNVELQSRLESTKQEDYYSQKNAKSKVSMKVAYKDWEVTESIFRFII